MPDTIFVFTDFISYLRIWHKKLLPLLHGFSLNLHFFVNLQQNKS